MVNVAKGQMYVRCWFDGSEEEKEQRRRLQDRDIDVSRVYRVEEIARGNVMFAFTAVTNGILEGVSYGPGGIAFTHTIKGRSRTGTHYYQKGFHKNPPPPPDKWPVVSGD